jgi:hypothetical protein
LGVMLLTWTLASAGGGTLAKAVSNLTTMSVNDMFARLHCLIFLLATFSLLSIRRSIVARWVSFPVLAAVIILLSHSKQATLPSSSPLYRGSFKILILLQLSTGASSSSAKIVVTVGGLSTLLSLVTAAWACWRAMLLIALILLVSSLQAACWAPVSIGPPLKDPARVAIIPLSLSIAEVVASAISWLLGLDLVLSISARIATISGLTSCGSSSAAASFAARRASAAAASAMVKLVESVCEKFQ